MRLCYVLFCIFGCSNSNAALTALTDSPYALKLYQDIWDAGNTLIFAQHRCDTCEVDFIHSGYSWQIPVEPSETDLAASNAQIRKQICRDITDNEWFYLSAEVALDEEELLCSDYNDREKYEDVLYQIYDTYQDSENSILYEYTNPYKRRQFSILSDVYEEYVFLCLGISVKNPGEVSTYYVSKEYNVNSLRSDELVYRPGRFVFPVFDPEQAPSELEVHNDIMLVEEPATVQQGRDFNVELHYLRTRKYIKQSAEGHHINPLCKLISEDEYDPMNQHHRFCVSIARSSAFMKRTIYPSNEPHLCIRKEISFRTRDATERAPAMPYTEMVAPCHVRIPGGDDFLYISRAYMSNQVFVYSYSKVDEKLYLVNLSSNISILDELNSFDFLED